MRKRRSEEVSLVSHTTQIFKVDAKYIEPNREHGDVIILFRGGEWPFSSVLPPATPSDANRRDYYAVLTQCSQFESRLFDTAQYHKLQTPLGGLYNLYADDIPDLWPHIGAGKSHKKYRKKPFKSEETFRRAAEEDQWSDTDNILHMCVHVHTPLHTHFRGRHLHIF